MKTLSPLVTLLLLLIATPLFAQTVEDIELARTIAQTEKKVIVAKNMNLTDSESEAFWPVYNDYQADVRKINDRMIKLIRDYSRDFQALSDKQAEGMLKELLDIQNERVKLKKSYVKKFRKALTPTKLMRYYQVENKIEAIIYFDLAKNIPLAR
jgi:hypothetical protein